MSAQRRHRPQRLALFIAATAALGSCGDTEPSLETTPLTASVHLVSGPPNGNMLVVSGSNGLLVIDAQDRQHATAAWAAVTTLGTVRTVINTHYHEDHLGANPLFREAGAKIIAHENLSRQAVKDTVVAELDWTRHAASPDALPTATVTIDTTLTIGGVRVWLLHAPNAHTDGDLMVWLPEHGVLHTGDIVEIGAYPFIDLWAGGSTKGTIAAVERLLSMVNDSTLIVPGHGPVSRRHDLLAYRDMLETVQRAVREAVDAGADEASIVNSGVTLPYDAARGGAEAGRRFVQIVYWDVTRER